MFLPPEARRQMTAVTVCLYAWAGLAVALTIATLINIVRGF